MLGVRDFSITVKMGVQIPKLYVNFWTTLKSSNTRFGNLCSEIKVEKKTFYNFSAMAELHFRWDKKWNMLNLT